MARMPYASREVHSRTRWQPPNSPASYAIDRVQTTRFSGGYSRDPMGSPIIQPTGALVAAGQLGAQHNTRRWVHAAAR